MKTTFRLLLLLQIIHVFTACDDLHSKVEPTPTLKETTDLYILCEGLINMNNSTLVHYSVKDTLIDKDYFTTKNGRGLGDTANDLKLYGSKIYIVVNVSSQVEVIDAETGISQKRIPLFSENGVPREPRCIAFYEDKAYVCCFDNTVVRIDTATLQTDAIVTVGRNPDGICATNNKLYVSNSGGLSYPNYDNTVSVIDITTFQEIKKIEVSINPYTIAADKYGDVYVASRGDYGIGKYCLQRIDSRTDQLIETFDEEVLNFCISGDLAYLYNYDYTYQTSWIKVMNVRTEEIVRDNFITDGTQITTPYGISTNEETGDVYITDAYDFMVTGDVACFGADGKLKYKAEDVGLNPNHVVPINRVKENNTEN